ncbi:hypothetical protein NDU88_004473 [Pleurodeles waltl]|uniref:Uncharacterized protein n=1 Tax=Pleurodeles waltl TaxID=8319 RepID=A0AAV7LIP1_PLEWA|nr:hypothetical protein NDU88_004473 [Pleurodeles waltl]
MGHAVGVVLSTSLSQDLSLQQWDGALLPVPGPLALRISGDVTRTQYENSATELQRPGVNKYCLLCPCINLMTWKGGAQPVRRDPVLFRQPMWRSVFCPETLL